MKVYFIRTNDYNCNCIVFAEGQEAIIEGCEPSGTFEGIDIYAEDAASRLKTVLEALNDAGDLNDFSQMPGDRQEIGHDLFEQLASAELIFSDGEGVQIWSVEADPDYTDDLFCGSLEECRKYCQECDYTIGENCRIARVAVDDRFCVVGTLEVVTEV